MIIRLAQPQEIAAGSPVAALLRSLGLPVEGVDQLWRAWLALAYRQLPSHVVAASRFDGSVEGRGLLGCAGLERHGPPGHEAYLLRSVAVRLDARDGGVGGTLVSTAIAAVPSGRTVALLTETAADWFPRFGFRPVARAELHPALSRSVELTSACPDTARAFWFRVP